MSMASMLRVCESVFAISGTCSCLVQHMYQVDSSEQTLWHQGSVVGRSSFSLNRPGLLRTRELGHATSPSVPHGVMR